MIKNFDEITYELTEFEEFELLPIMLKALSQKIGSGNVVSNKQMKKGLLNICGIKVSDARIRKIIHHIRVKQLIKGLIANSKGYYVAESKEEIQTFVDSLQQRINSIETVKMSFFEFLPETIIQSK